MVKSGNKSHLCIINERGVFLCRDVSLLRRFLPAIILVVDLFVFISIYLTYPSILHKLSLYLLIIYGLAILLPAGNSIYIWRSTRKISLQFLNDSKSKEPSISWSLISKATISSNRLEFVTSTEYGSISTRLNRKAPSFPKLQALLTGKLGDGFLLEHES